MSNRIRITLIILLTYFSSLAFGQGGSCAKFRIGVYVDEISGSDTTANYLNEKHKKDFTLEQWANEIESKIFEELNSAGYNDLEFFSPKSNPMQKWTSGFHFPLCPGLLIRMK